MSSGEEFTEAFMEKASKGSGGSLLGRLRRLLIRRALKRQK